MSINRQKEMKSYLIVVSISPPSCLDRGASPRESEARLLRAEEALRVERPGWEGRGQSGGPLSYPHHLPRSVHQPQAIQPDPTEVKMLFSL